MISIGVIAGGPEKTLFLEVVRPFMKHCRIAREGIADEAEVNIVFDLPGTIRKPAFFGIVPDKFSKANKIVMVKVAVEAEWMALQNNEEIVSYIYSVSDEALGVAKSIFDKKGIAYEIDNDRKIIDSWLSADKI